MIIVTKQGDRSSIPYLFSYYGAVFIFPFFMSSTYIDPFDGSSWTWEGYDYSIDEILGVIDDDGNTLFNVLSVSDCAALEGSFYWNDENGYLYVHWFDSVNDFIIDRDIAVMSKIIAGYASGYNAVTQNVFDEVYYKPIIVGLSGLSKKVDPIELGLIAFSGSSFTISDYKGDFDDIPEEAAVGLPVWFYRIEDTDIELTNDKRIFTGYLNGTEHDRSNIKFNIIETRLYENKPVCRNTITVAEFPDCGDNADKLKPVAFGTIRRGLMVCTNIGIKTSPYPDPMVLTFLVADPAHYAVREISAVYDEYGNEFPIDSVNLAACTVTITSADYTGTVEEFAEFEFGDWTWSGKGYDIDGTYNNGLDIIRAAFLKLANVPYLASTYDQTQWAAQRIAHPEKCGISIQSDKGFIEEIIEPITVSLYGVVDILGDGRISFRSRDISNPVSDTIYAVDQMKEPAIRIDTEKLVSELVVEYAPDFANDKNNLQFVYTDDSDEVIGRYGVNRREPLSPIQTVLFEESAAEDLAEKLMSVHSSPDKQITVDSLRIINQQLFDIIGIDIGRHNQEELVYGELLSFEPDYLNQNEKITIRLIDNPVIENVPPSPHIIAAMCYAPGSAVVIFSEILTQPVDGYHIYYTTNPVNWDDNVIDYTVLQYDSDGYLYRNIPGLTPGTLYYFRISAYDSTGKSPLSNFAMCFVWDNYNSYRFNGDFISGFIIDATNTLAGVPLSTWALYDGTHLYNGATAYQPALLFASGVCFNPYGFNLLRILGHSESGAILLQYRHSADNITWSAWTAEIDINSDVQIVLADYKYFEYRIIGEPTYWQDDDYFMVKRLQ
jgi:hypothetical protein